MDECFKEIFRAYDIRGVVDETMTAENVEKIGHAIGTLAKQKDVTEIIVARDGRLSGPTLLDALSNGLRAAGLTVIDIGAAPTPVLYYAACQLESKSGVVLTGSHNPANYNGLKMVLAGETLWGNQIQALHEIIANNTYYHAETPGDYSQRTILETYTAAISERVALADKPLKVVIDCGNGITGCIAEKLYQSLGIEVIPLYTEVDGTFPNHHPDPSVVANLQDVIHAVAEHKADVGLAFDGDGDRLGIVTDAGEIIWPDRLMMCFAKDILADTPDASFIYDVKCTQQLKKYIEQHHGTPIMWKTGHSLVKAKLKETQAELAGEMSGHFFFNDRWFGFDDALYSGARLLEIISKLDQPLSEFFQQLPNTVNTPEIKVAIAEKDKHAFVETLAANANFPGGEIYTLDGIRVDYPNGFGLVRASNTTPCLVCRFEAETQEQLNAMMADFKQQMLAVNSQLSIAF